MSTMYSYEEVLEINFFNGSMPKVFMKVEFL
ncbi:hypothetical protein AX13_17940 [Comamonas aquatica DA1877]|uniref:Uncharacterized protein n=1 Tax=Comamonas aquatica DA1877 TaxID=1457173 RepID=A0A014MEK4_9BURK|nr:hypothetical protein AX13_17940 [Comamonas aquatica DA1877]